MNFSWIFKCSGAICGFFSLFSLRFAAHTLLRSWCLELPPRPWWWEVQGSGAEGGFRCFLTCTRKTMLVLHCLLPWGEWGFSFLSTSLLMKGKNKIIIRFVAFENCASLNGFRSESQNALKANTWNASRALPKAQTFQASCWEFFLNKLSAIPSDVGFFNLFSYT